MLYVKSYSKDERCRLAVDTPKDEESIVDFTVHFGECGLVHVNVSFETMFIIYIFLRCLNCT